MEYMTDIEIAQNCRMRPITEIAERAGIDEQYVEQYGRYKEYITDGRWILIKPMVFPLVAAWKFEEAHNENSNGND